MLGVEPGASPDEIKAAWRALARRHHPDLIGDDPETAQRATRRMAEINTAYAALTRAGRRRRRSGARRAAGRTARPGSVDGHRRGARADRPPPPEDAAGHRPARPVGQRPAAKPDDSPPGSRIPLSGQPPLRWDRSEPELRASQPSGPMEIRRDPRYVPPVAPPLDDALVREVEFGKFHGHTLGEIAAFEPSYIDWLAGTVTRDPELALAARVIRDELDRRGIIRTTSAGAAGLAVEPVPLAGAPSRGASLSLPGGAHLQMLRSPSNVVGQPERA